jgi:two-component system OmpR family response regulator
MEIDKVLIVDDDPSIRKIAEISLRAVGNWNVVSAEGGEAAIKTAQEEKPDLILLDVMMPNMDGPTTFKRLREMNCSTPVIFVTAKVMKQEIDAYCKLGAIGVVTKPFDPMTLPDEIRAMTSSVVQFKHSDTELVLGSDSDRDLISKPEWASC